MVTDIMFNTDMYQRYPDYYYEEPAQPQEKMNNNNRYKYYRQNHFTAGDEEQFIQYWDTESPTLILEKPLSLKEFLFSSNIHWTKYKNLNLYDILNTYKYISDKFKKGLYLKIVNGKGKVFLPFSKNDYQNEWSSSIHINPKNFKSINDMMEYTAKIENRVFSSSRIHKNIKAWYGNNGLVRLEYPPSEGESGVNMIKDMISTLIQERNLPSFEGFINKRDFPLLKLNDTESYHAFFGSKTKLLSHQYPKYAPILSMTTSMYHADIPIPTWEDWCRVQYWYDKRLFGKEYRTFPSAEELDTIEWNTKIETAIFRGASTGLGTTIQNNVRLQMASESEKNICDMDGIPFLNVGITKWNLRPRKHPNSNYLETILLETMPFSLKPSMSVLEQCQYKYILHLPGHSEAYRLGYELYMGSVILYYPCEYKVWFFDWLKPWVHYVPLTGSIQDVYDKIKWCKDNDMKCREIVKNARQFAHQYLDREPILDYLESLFWTLQEKTKNIHYIPKHILYHNFQKYQETKKYIDVCMSNHLIYLEKDISYLNQLEDISNIHPILIQYLMKYNQYQIIPNELECIKTGKNTIIYKFMYKKKIFILKRTKKNWKQENAFQNLCSYQCINSLHLSLPYFNYCYYDYEWNNEYHDSIYDYLEGNTIEYFLTENLLSFQELVTLYMILCLILYKSQEKYGFIHMDLYPWNVMIQKVSKPISYEFVIENKTLVIEFSYKINIIDYGKSHFMDNGLIYYNSVPFLFCSAQDIISFLFSTLYLFIQKNDSPKYEANVVSLMSFFWNLPYTQNYKLNNLFKIKLFLKQHKKFNKMLGEPKKGLETLNILSLFEHFQHISSCPSVQIENTNTPFLLYFPTNPSLLVLFYQYVENQLFYQCHKTVLDYRQLWIQNEQLWNIYLSEKNTVLQTMIYYVLESLFMDLQRESEKNQVWSQLQMSEILTSFPIFTNSILFEKKILEDTYYLPKYMSHINYQDISKIKEKISLDVFNIQFMYEKLPIEKEYIFPYIHQLGIIKTLKYLYSINKNV
jgi:hypothetical protein